jgi:sugar lactone lactonase YvrE
MNRPRLSNLRAFPVLLLVATSILSPLSVHGQFATLLDTTSRYAGGSSGSPVFNGDGGSGILATATDLNVPTDVVFDSVGNLYISDAQNNCVRKVTPAGAISTVAGLRVNGGPDTCNTADGIALDPVAGLEDPLGLAIDSNNTLYIVDGQHNCVRSLAYNTVDSNASPALTTVAGTCGEYSSSATPSPIGLAVDSNSNLYISLAVTGGGNELDQVVLHRSSDAPTKVCAVAGQLSTYPYGAAALCAGVASTVTLNRPSGIAFDKNGDLFIADSSNNCVREIAGLTTSQTVVGKCLSDQSSSNTTVLNNPYGLAFSADGSLYISESGTIPPAQNNVVSFNFGTNTLSAIAGLPSGLSGAYSITQEGQPALQVPLNQPLGVTTDIGGSIYLADSQNNIVRKMGTNLSFPATDVGSTSASQTVVFSINQSVSLSTAVGLDYTIVSSTCAGSLVPAGAGLPPNTCEVVIAFRPTRPGYRYSALVLKDAISGKQIGVALEGLGIGPLSLLTPGVVSTRGSGVHNAVAVTTDSAGDAYVLEQGNGSTTADVLFYPAGGGAAQVVVPQGVGLLTPTAMAVDGAGNIYVANSSAAPGSNTNIARFGADGSINLSYATGLLYVNSLAIDGFDNLFVATGGSIHNVTEIYAGGQQRVVAGNGTVVDANNVVATTAVFYDPSAVAVGPNGLTIADAGSHYVYTIDSSGIIHVVAGNGTTSTTTAGVATGTGLNAPDALAVDAAGDIYIADDRADRVYEVYSVVSNGVNIASVVGTGAIGYTGDGGPSTAATLAGPVAIALDGSADLFVVDSGNNALREVSYPTTSNINFGNVAVGTTSNPVLQYLTNAGNATLALTTPFTTTESHYAVSPATTTCTNSTLPGAVCDIGYTYSPTAVGPAPAGQSNLPSNSYNSAQIVYFNAYGYATGQNLPYILTNPETEVYGSPFIQSLQLSLVAPFIDPTGAMAFSVGAETTCTVSGPFASGSINCNAPNSGLPVGSYTVNFHYTTGDINYTSATGTTTLNVTKAPLTFNAGQYSRAYGAVNPVFSPQVINGASGDSFTVTYATPASAASPVGSYPVTAQLTPVGATSLANYSVTNTAGALSVTQAPLTVTVNNATRAYGTTNPTFTSTVAGLLNGDTVTVTYSTVATIASSVGSYAITATVSGPAAANYTVQVVPGTLTITPSTTPVVVTVNNATRGYEWANPTFTSAIAGALNSDSFTVTYSTTATATSSVGSYPITAIVTGGNIGNYATVNVVPGTLSITPDATVTTVTTSASSVNQGTNITFTATVTYLTGLGSATTVGSGVPTTVSFYNGPTLLGTGTLNPSGVATISASSLPAGSYTITATYASSLNFSGSSATVPQDIDPGTFTLTAAPPSQFIRGPGTTVYSVTVNSVQGFAGPVALTCTGLPADASCTFASPTVTLEAGGSVSTTMTVVNTEADARLSLPSSGTPNRTTPGGFSPIAFAAVFPFGVGAFFAGLSRRKRDKQQGGNKPRRTSQIRLLLALLCTVGIVSLAGCACLSSVSNVYVIPITGTSTVSETTAQSTSVSLTVAQ